MWPRYETLNRMSCRLCSALSSSRTMNFWITLNLRKLHRFHVKISELPCRSPHCCIKFLDVIGDVNRMRARYEEFPLFLEDISYRFVDIINNLMIIDDFVMDACHVYGSVQKKSIISAFISIELCSIIRQISSLACMPASAQFPIKVFFSLFLEGTTWKP